jgi:hypothetical protein
VFLIKNMTLDIVQKQNNGNICCLLSAKKNTRIQNRLTLNRLMHKGIAVAAASEVSSFDSQMTMQ